jgi:hypothetical protein
MISVKTSADDFNRTAALSPAYESPAHNSPTVRQIDTQDINLFGFMSMSSTASSQSTQSFFHSPSKVKCGKYNIAQDTHRAGAFEDLQELMQSQDKTT